MKYFLKIDLVYIIFLLLMIMCVILILSFFSEKIFSLKQATIFVISLLSPIYILLLIFYTTTFFSAQENYFEVYYFGVFRKQVPYQEIESIRKVDDGIGLLALSNKKLLIEYEENEIVISLKKNDEFFEEIYSRVNLVK